MNYNYLVSLYTQFVSFVLVLVIKFTETVCLCAYTHFEPLCFTKTGREAITNGVVIILKIH